MYAVVRRAKVKPGSADVLARGVNEVAAPMMNSMPGFIAYYVVYAEDNTVIVLDVFEDKATSEEATRQMVGAITGTLGSLLAGPPEAIEGEVIAHKAG